MITNKINNTKIKAQLFPHPHMISHLVLYLVVLLPNTIYEKCTILCDIHDKKMNIVQLVCVYLISKKG